MLQAATYLERALIAEYKADNAISEGMRDSYQDIAKSWRSLADNAYNEELGQRGR
jgi:hypothetical protein